MFSWRNSCPLLSARRLFRQLSRLAALLCGLFSLFPGTATATAPSRGSHRIPPFELRDGDRVVFLGNTLIERAQKYGYWETLLTARYPNRRIIFRNLGWDGDTVWAESRGLFDPPAKGYARLLEQVGRIRPTVIFLGYGNNEAFAGKKGLPRFLRQYNQLLDDLTKVSAHGVRFVLFSPTSAVRLSPLLPDPAAYNRAVRLYAAAIRQMANSRNARFIDFMDITQPATREANGIHFSRKGYQKLAARMEQSLFTAAAKTGTGNPYEKLRRAIVEKNRLYFLAWRPQNITYLFLFRKHEQGQNAKEVKELLQRVAEKENEIDRLKKSFTHTAGVSRGKPKK